MSNAESKLNDNGKYINNLAHAEICFSLKTAVWYNAIEFYHF